MKHEMDYFLKLLCFYGENGLVEKKYIEKTYLPLIVYE